MQRCAVQTDAYAHTCTHTHSHTHTHTHTHDQTRRSWFVLNDARDKQGRIVLMMLIRNMRKASAQMQPKELLAEAMRLFLFVQLSTMFEEDAQNHGIVLVYDYEGLDLMYTISLQVCIPLFIHTYINTHIHTRIHA